MTLLTSYTVGPVRQDNIKIVHGDIDELVSTGLYNVLIVQHKNDTTFTPLIADAHSNAHGVGSLYETSSISVGQKFINVIFLNVDGSNSTSFVSLEAAIKQLANTYKGLNVGVVNDSIEYGEWAVLMPTFIHFSKLTLLKAQFDNQTYTDLPHLDATNETAEQ